MIQIREVTLSQYAQDMRRYYENGAVIHCTFLHHTYIPDANSYKGIASIKAIQRDHIFRRGFHDIACGVYCGPDGKIFPARPPTVWNCACQLPRKPWKDIPLSLRLLINQTRGNMRWDHWPNAYGYGVETVGNFDREDPTTSMAMKTSLDVIAEVHKIWGLPASRCYFHRHVAYKTCPGKRVKEEWVRSELERRIGAVKTLKVVLLPGTTVIDCNAVIENGTTRCNLRPLSESLGYEVIDHIEDQGKIYIREKNEEAD